MYLLGASGHAKVVIEILEGLNIPVTGLLDDNIEITAVNGIPVVSTIKNWEGRHSPCIITIGNNSIRKVISTRIRGTFHTAVHRSAICSKSALISQGTVVMAGAVINAGAVIGRHCIINTMASVDHDCVLGDFVHISPNACLCGGVSVGEGSHVCAGATIAPNVTIGKWATIGAGAIVLKNVPDYAVVVGNPGKIIKYNSA